MSVGLLRPRVAGACARATHVRYSTREAMSVTAADPVDGARPHRSSSDPNGQATGDTTGDSSTISTYAALLEMLLTKPGDVSDVTIMHKNVFDNKLTPHLGGNGSGVSNDLTKGAHGLTPNPNTDENVGRHKHSAPALSTA